MKGFARPSRTPWIGAHANRCAALCLALLLAGCHATPERQPLPEAFIPTGFTQGSGTAPTGQVSVWDPANRKPLIHSEMQVAEWWRDFANPELNTLIQQGISNNPDLRIARARTEQARARLEQAGAGKKPTLTAPVVTAAQAPAGTSLGVAPTSASGADPASRLLPAHINQASVRADWRLDLWGEQSSLVDSAEYQLQRAHFERQNVLRNLTAAIAANYIEYLSLNDRLRIARDTERILYATLETIEKRFQAGDASLPELEQQKAAVYSARATIPGLEQQWVEAINTLALLTGTPPGQLRLSDQGLDSLTAPDTSPGIPSALLLNRPDVRAAEAQLLAANADIEVARARILPTLDLSSQAGYSNDMLNQLFLPGALFWNAVSSLTVSLFDGGRKANEVKFTQAVREEMVGTYLKTVHTAIKDVENALSGIRTAEQRTTAHRNATQAAQKAWEISARLYNVGGIDYLGLLDAQRSYNRYLDDFQRSRADFYRGHVNLLQALGGSPESLDKDPRTPPDEAGQTAGASWQIELGGLHPYDAVGAVWRDLNRRFPAQMTDHTVRPRVQDPDSDPDEIPYPYPHSSLYRLYISDFGTREPADAFCKTLNASRQRCRVVSIQRGEALATSDE